MALRHIKIVPAALKRLSHHSAEIITPADKNIACKQEKLEREEEM